MATKTFQPRQIDTMLGIVTAPPREVTDFDLGRALIRADDRFTYSRLHPIVMDGTFPALGVAVHIEMGRAKAKMGKVVKALCTLSELNECYFDHTAEEGTVVATALTELEKIHSTAKICRITPIERVVKELQADLEDCVRVLDAPLPDDSTPADDTDELEDVPEMEPVEFEPTVTSDGRYMVTPEKIRPVSDMPYYIAEYMPEFSVEMIGDTPRVTIIPVTDIPTEMMGVALAEAEAAEALIPEIMAIYAG